MKYSKEEIIRYRIERAFESIEEAKILSQFQHWNTVVNRLYYACFYIVQALLIMNDAKVSTHSGTKTEFHRRFIKTEILPRELGKLYSNLFNKRQEGDYQVIEKFLEEDIKPLIIKSEEFIQIINGLIQN